MESQRVDVVLYPSGEVKAVPAGKGGEIVRSYHERSGSRDWTRRALAGGLAVLVVMYSLLIVRNLLLGVIAAGVVFAAVHLLPRVTGSDASLLDSDVTLRDAREQWEASPVSGVGESGTADRRRQPEHAFE